MSQKIIDAMNRATAAMDSAAAKYVAQGELLKQAQAEVAAAGASSPALDEAVANLERETAELEAATAEVKAEAGTVTTETPAEQPQG